MIRILPSTEVGRLLGRKAARFAEAEQTVRPILDGVRKRGDKAVLEYANQFDSLNRKSVVVSSDELQAAEKQLTRPFRDAIRTASKNIRAFAKLQLPEAKSAV